MPVLDSPQMIPAVQPAASPVASSEAAGDRKLRAAAKQFEAMFMSEMLRLARAPAKAAGSFAPGQGEKSWQIMMDQALGQAASAQGGTGGIGLAREIEKALRMAQGQHSTSDRSKP